MAKDTRGILGPPVEETPDEDRHHQGAGSPRKRGVSSGQIHALLEAAGTVDLSQFSTRQDLLDLRAELKADHASLRSELREDQVALRSEFREDQAGLRLAISDLRAEMHSALRQQALTIIGAIGVLLALFRVFA
ncbi:MAG: hypothetical protein QM699_06010 [Amaricoccus sp.]|uniref:hypothetical protein n=1 Tax=Amaricoccus sp. TaxID=1872485 RepID=UPI0039E551CB